MVYRAPWIDEEARRLDEAEIAAFRRVLRARRRSVLIEIVLVAVAGCAIAFAAASGPRERDVSFTRKPGCVYDGCFCWSEDGELVRTACAPPELRECLPIASRCDAPL